MSTGIEITDGMRRLVADNASIPDEQVEQDIADTEAEITKLNEQVDAYSKLATNANSPVEAKMSAFRRDVALSGIRERQLFIDKLRGLLEARAAIKTAKEGV